MFICKEKTKHINIQLFSIINDNTKNIIILFF
jgi:hypothetical protein